MHGKARFSHGRAATWPAACGNGRHLECVPLSTIWPRRKRSHIILPFSTFSTRPNVRHSLQLVGRQLLTAWGREQAQAGQFRVTSNGLPVQGFAKFVSVFFNQGWTPCGGGRQYQSSVRRERVTIVRRVRLGQTASMTATRCTVRHCHCGWSRAVERGQASIYIRTVQGYGLCDRPRLQLLAMRIRVTWLLYVVLNRRVVRPTERSSSFVSYWYKTCRACHLLSLTTKPAPV